ncbi:MAG: hypothetical protein H0T75_10530, partial [Rhizobiales bacterium]|nr:hypothetical protein [Hyphomicrobiales bacterium]
MDRHFEGFDLAGGTAAGSRLLSPHSDMIASKGTRNPGPAARMRITYRVFLVGGIPITIAAAIALAALVLLSAADRARDGAVLAGTIYRNLLAARTARDDFLETTRGERTRYFELFLSNAEQARFDLLRLAGVSRDPVHERAANEAREALARYRDDMRRFVDVTIR